MVADSIIYSDIPDNSPIIKGGNQEVSCSYSNISRFNTIDVKLDFQNCDKQYICFGEEKFLLNKKQKISSRSLVIIPKSKIIGLLYKENMEISILVSPMRKFVFKIGNNPDFEWQGFDIVGTPVDIKQFWVNLLIEGFVNESQVYRSSTFSGDIAFTPDNVSLCFSPNELQRNCRNFIFFEIYYNNGRKSRIDIMTTFHIRSGYWVDEQNPKDPFVTGRIVDNYSSEVGQFFEKCPTVLVFIAALIGCKLHCVEVKRYRIAGYDPINKNGVDYDVSHSRIASFPIFEFVGPKPIIREEWLGQDGNRRAAEYIVEHFYERSLKYYSLPSIKMSD